MPRLRIAALAAISAAGALLAALPASGLPAFGGSTGSASRPLFATFPAPAGLANGAGEPSIGANWLTGNALFQSDTATYRVAFSDTGGRDTGRPGVRTHQANWTDVSPTLASTLGSSDPILWTDSVTGRTIESQLNGPCSFTFTTDIDGASWLPSTGCGVVTLRDHQTVGGGPFTASLPLHPAYPHAVYYCAQDGLLTENCARSDDGGHTFGVGVPIFNLPNQADRCQGLTGHLRVGPDGTAYVPDFDCNGRVAVTVSENNGLSWQVRPVPTSTTQDESDPSVSIGPAGTVYLGWEEGAKNSLGSRAYVGVSHDHGRTWTSITDVGAAFGIRNVQFPELITGDDNRAAYAFLGSPTAGNDQAGGAKTLVGASDVFPGVWHLYVALTYDGGRTWTTVDTTPHDPVQRGCIWLQGGGGSCRNLLDFNDITVDKLGRVLVAYVDGCLGVCDSRDLAGTDAYDSPGNKVDYRAKHGVIARLVSGRGLFAATDGQIR